MSRITPCLWFDGKAEEAAGRTMLAVMHMTMIDNAAIEAARRG